MALVKDGYLSLKGNPELWIQKNPAHLLSVRFLELRGVDKVGNSIGKLSQLTHLTIDEGDFECLPNSVTSLPNLQRLGIHDCPNLQELPADLGDLNTLTSLSLSGCSTINSLPKSIHKLSKLTSLTLLDCPSLNELPAISNLVDLSLYHCPNILPLPKGLCNLKDLSLALCSKPDFIYLPSLCRLTFNSCCDCPDHLEQAPANVGELSQLLTINIQDTTVKWLPWSITKLSKLRLLSLPGCFIIETLPKHLNDSLVISVKHTHIRKTHLNDSLVNIVAHTYIRKTWKEVKTEIQLFSIPVIGVEATHPPSTPGPGYLHYRHKPGPWIQINSLYSLVRILDLDLAVHEFDKSIMNSIGKLPELTHLYISYAYLLSLPLTLPKLTHLSLFKCRFQSCWNSLGKLLTLESLTIIECKNLPFYMDLPVSLTHFAMGYCSFGIIPNDYMTNYITSMTKLSNLKTLNLSGYEELELSQLHMNLTKLMIKDCNFHSLPRSLKHLEIMWPRGGWLYSGECWDELQVCLNQLVDLETLCVRFCEVKVLSNIPRHQNLKELQLIDCFNLENLPPNLDELVELRTLNLSGTNIKTLPDSITKLQNLQHLILPKCFIRKSLPKNLEDKVRVSIDVTYDKYYEHQGYNDSSNGSNKDNNFTSRSSEQDNEVVSQDSGHDIIIEEASSHNLLKPLPDATQVHEGSHFSSSGTVPIANGFSSSQNREMEILATVNKDCVVPLAPNNFSSVNETDGAHYPSNKWQADPTELEGSLNGIINAVGESSSHALCNFQNQEMGILTLRNRDYCVIPSADHSAATSSSNLHESQQCFHSGEMVIINSENEQRNQPCDLIDSARGGNDHNALEDGQDKISQSVDVKHKKMQKIEVPEESIRKKMSRGMTLEGAAKELGISRSTMKRKLKDYSMVWPSSRKRMQRQDAQNKNHDTASHDHAVEQSDGANQHTLSDHPLFERNVVNQSSLDAILEESTLPTQCQMDGCRYVGEHSNNANEGMPSKTVHQPNEVSSTFVVKATFGEDTVKFDFSISSSTEQLKEEVGKRLELEIDKFKLKYQDGDKEWILMTDISNLKDALHLSKSSGSNVVRLSVLSKT